MEQNMKVITLCGSTRFKDEFDQMNSKLTLEGNIVFSCEVFGHSINREITEDEKRMLDEIHLKKIDMSDEIFVINKDNYIGESTSKEIAYAKNTGKAVSYFQNPNTLRYPRKLYASVLLFEGQIVGWKTGTGHWDSVNSAFCSTQACLVSDMFYLRKSDFSVDSIEFKACNSKDNERFFEEISHEFYDKFSYHKIFDLTPGTRHNHIRTFYVDYQPIKLHKNSTVEIFFGGKVKPLKNQSKQKSWVEICMREGKTSKHTISDDLANDIYEFLRSTKSDRMSVQSKYRAFFKL